MAFPTKDGERKYGNRMKANRYDRAHEKADAPKEKEAPAEEMPAEEPPAEPAEEGDQGDMHGEIKQVVAEHGPASEVHMMHDDGAKKSMVHSKHQDGHEQQAEMDGDDHKKNAHDHALHASGVEITVKPEAHSESDGQDPNDEYEM